MSTLLLLVFLSVVFTSVTGVVKHQIHQYRQTAYSYEAKALIEMTEVLLLETGNPDQGYLKKVEFSTGNVTVSRKESSVYLLEAVLHNRYTSRKEVTWPGNMPLDVENDTVNELINENESAESDRPSDYPGKLLSD